MKNNEILKQEIKKQSFPQWLLAEVLGISEKTLIVWLRKELPEEKEKRIWAGIEELKTRK